MNGFPHAQKKRAALNDDDRAALHDSLRRGIAQADAGTLIDADVALGELERGNA